MAPNFIAVCTAFFIARRKATRRSSWVAMFSAIELGVGLGLADLLDVQEDLVLRERLNFLLQLLDAGAALADDDARTRGVDVDLRLVRGALDVDAGDARVLELLLDELLEA